MATSTAGTPAGTPAGVNFRLEVDHIGLLALARESVQVELKGQYSQQRLQAFRDYASHVRFIRAIAVILLTSLSCLLVVLLADAIPLEDPKVGIRRSVDFWVRTVFFSAVFTRSLLSQCEYHVPRLSLSMRERLGIVFAVTLLITIVTYALADAVGFPIPFAISILTTPWMVLFIVFMGIARGHLICQDDEVRLQVQNFFHICASQAFMTVVYQAFYDAFSQISTSAQIKAVLVLLLLKLVQKNLISRLLHCDQLLDTKPEVVTLTVELFRSMFVSCCMQRSTSVYSSLVLIGADFCQVCLSLYDLNCILRDLETLEKEHGLQREEIVAIALDSVDNGAASTRSLTEQAGLPLATDKGIRRSSSARVHALAAIAAQGDSSPVWTRILSSQPKPPHNEAVRVTPILVDKHALMAIEEKSVLAQSFLRAMYLTEFLLLIEFIEVMIPITYCVYLVTLFHLPNRVFYPHLANVDVQSLQATAQSVLLYASMELCSLVVLMIMIRRRLHISGIHHLAFVLEKQALHIQSKLVFWFFFVLQSTLVHLGADYSFKFEWLHGTAQANSPNS